MKLVIGCVQSKDVVSLQSRCLPYENPGASFLFSLGTGKPGRSHHPEPYINFYSVALSVLDGSSICHITLAAYKLTTTWHTFSVSASSLVLA